MTASTAPSRDALVTGEAVLLDLRPASFAARALSFAIDGLTQLGILVGGVWALTSLDAGLALDPGYLAAGVIVVSVTAVVGYPVLTEVLCRGRSLGRLALGTRVVRDDGGPVHARQSILRAISAMFEIWMTTGAIALVVALIDPRSRRVGDLLAGTFVVQDRLRAPERERVAVPVGLADWARQADLGPLAPSLLRDVRSFLPRADSLHPSSRRTLALDLVQRVVPAVAPPPPPGTEPEAFLRAVLAERSRRDEERLRAALSREKDLARQVRALPFVR